MKKTLFIAGGWEGHQPFETSNLFAELLKADGFETEVSSTVESLLDKEYLDTLDLIVPCYTMGEISQDQVDALDKVVRTGCGLAGWHGGMGDAFRQNPRYQFMTGGQWVDHPGNATKKYRVNILDRHHPITEGIESFDIVSEQYYMHTDLGNRVLANTMFDGEFYPWIEGTVMPVAWTRSWGTGRVFYSSLGHQLSDFDNPAIRRLTLNGLKWAARSD